MKLICAWCKQEMTGDPDDPVVSHGICIPCAHLFELDTPEPQERKRDERQDPRDHVSRDR
jgi:hypothetical protein